MAADEILDRVLILSRRTTRLCEAWRAVQKPRAQSWRCRETDAAKKDAFLDQAKSELDKACAIQSNESEIVAIEGFIHMVRVTVDPATRGQKYSSLAMQAFGKAISLNPENPRALMLLAQMQLGTARFFNSSTAEACATAQKALEKYNSYKP